MVPAAASQGVRLLSRGAGSPQPGLRINWPWSWSGPEARALIKLDTARADLLFSETGNPPSGIELIASPRGILMAGISSPLTPSIHTVARLQKPVR